MYTKTRPPSMDGDEMATGPKTGSIPELQYGVEPTLKAEITRRTDRADLVI